MGDSNVQSSRGVTLVGGGDPRAESIRRAMAFAPDLVAADGGANACVAAGLKPIAVIGDLDSVAPEARKTLSETRFIHVAEQDSTDFEKSLTRIAAPFIIAVGFAAARVDHTLAALSALARHTALPTLILSETDVIFAAPPHIVLDLAPGTRVSLFPFAPVSGRSTGLQWPIEGLRLDPMGRIGTSNEATGRVTFDFDGPGCLVILPQGALQAALAALTGSPVVRAE